MTVSIPVVCGFMLVGFLVEAAGYVGGNATLSAYGLGVVCSMVAVIVYDAAAARWAASSRVKGDIP